MNCQHWWIVSSKLGQVQQGVCRECGTQRVFTNQELAHRSKARMAGNRNSAKSRALEEATSV